MTSRRQSTNKSSGLIKRISSPNKDQLPPIILIRIVGGGVNIESTRYVGHYWPIVPAPGECDDREFGGLKIGRGNRSTRRKPTPTPLCPPQIPHDQTRVWNPGRRGGKPATNRLSYGAASATQRNTVNSLA
jgi:hypothetical protein